MKRKVLSVLLSSMLFVSSFPIYADDTQKIENLENELKDLENKYNQALINKDSKPDFVINGNSLYEGLTTDEIQVLKVQIKNNSSTFAKDIFAELVDPNTNNSDSIILPQGSELTSKLSDVSGSGIKTLEFKLNISKKASPTSHKLLLKLKYKNSFGVQFEKELPIYIKINNLYVKPSINIGNYEVDGGYAASSNAKKLRIKLLNNSNVEVKNMTATLMDLSADGIELFEDSDVKLVGNMSSGTNIFVDYNIKASEGAKGSKALRLRLNYYDEQGTKYEQDWPLYIPTETSEFLIKDLKGTFSSELYEINVVDSSDSDKNLQKITLNLTNTSNKDMKDIKLNLSADGGLKFITPYTKIININKGQTQKIDFILSANDTSTAGVVPITASVSNLNSQNSEILAITGINVKKNSDSKSKPKIIINEYSYGNDFIKAGDIFELDVKFLNTSSGLGIKNVKVNYESEDGVFVPVNQTNSFFFSKIDAGQMAEKRIKLKAKADAKVKLYTITFKLEYEDSTGKAYDQKGNLFTSEEKLTVDVKQDIRLEIGEPNIPEFITVGEGASIDVEFYNMGKSILYNMFVKIEGDFDTKDSKYYVGNFDIGKSDSYNAMVIPTHDGENKGKIIFSFEDETGEKKEIEKEVTFNVSEEIKDLEHENINSEIETVNKNKGFSPILLVGGILLLIGGVVAYKKVKKGKKVEVDDED